MKIFSYLYNKTINLSAHKHATYYLAGISFAESSFFPIPPDVMLISMGLAIPRKSWQYALIATLFSVIGGIFGYMIGFFGMKFLEPYILVSSYNEQFLTVSHWLQDKGVWIVILGSFTPFPYKIFTITAGFMHLHLGAFIIGSIIGRGLRFFLVSGLLYFAGDKLNKHLRASIDIIGWITLILIIIIYFIWKLKG